MTKLKLQEAWKFRLAITDVFAPYDEDGQAIMDRELLRLKPHWFN